MMSIYDVLEISKSVSIQPRGLFGAVVPARPEVEWFWSRLSDAWEVLRGRADAIEWPEGQ